MSDTNNHQTLINIVIILFVEEHADSRIIDEDQGSAWLRVF